MTGGETVWWNAVLRFTVSYNLAYVTLPYSKGTNNLVRVVGASPTWNADLVHSAYGLANDAGIALDV